MHRTESESAEYFVEIDAPTSGNKVPDALLLFAFLLSRHNPFLDPPLSANSDTSPSGFGAYSDRPDRRSSTGTPTLPAGAFLNSSTNSGRPDMQRRTASRTDTMTSATSMQYLFDTRGQLRVANDPTQIETPVVSGLLSFFLILRNTWFFGY